MRTIDDVMREFGVPESPCWSDLDNAVDRMAERILQQEARIRELESPQAASEPVAWADRLADAVRKLVRVLNDGDDVSALALALEATEKALAQFDDSKRCCGLCDAGECKYEIAHPSAAGVQVTEEMVKRAADEMYGIDVSGVSSGAEAMYMNSARKVLTAALTAASEGASDATP